MMIDFIREYWLNAVGAILLAFMVWNGFKIELSIGNKLYFSYEIYKFKKIMRYF